MVSLEQLNNHQLFMKEKIIKISNFSLEASFCLLFFLIPLILTPWNYELFEFNKMVLTYGLTVIILGAWLIKIIAAGELKIQRTPLDIPLLFFLISQIFSTIFSIDRHTSIFGYYSRFHGGLLSTGCYLFLYYALVSNLNDKKKVFRFFYISLFSGFLVAVYGILEHYGIDAKFWVQDVRNRVFSTLGQPNWLAAYLNILLFITIGLIFTVKNKFKIFIYYLLFIICYLCLLYTKSRSGFIAFISCFVFSSLLLLAIGFLQKKLKTIFELLGACCLLLITITFFAQLPFLNLDKLGFSRVNKLFRKNAATVVKPPEALPQGPVLEVGGSESGEIRRIVWQGAIDIALNSPLFGSGVETFAYAYYQFRPAAHNLVSEWDFLYNKAHNEFLNYAATTGFIGLSSYLLVIFFFGWWFIKKMWEVRSEKIDIEVRSGNFKTKRLNHQIIPLPYPASQFPLLTSLFCGYLTILITNFFGFSVVIVAIYFWLIPAFVFIISDSLNPAKIIFIKFSKDIPFKNKKPKIYAFQKQENLAFPKKQIALITLSVFATGFLMLTIFRYWQADTKYALGYNYDKAGSFTTAYQFIKEAIALNPNEPIYYDELSYNTANLAFLAFSQKQNQLATQFINEALASSQKAIKTSLNNVTFWKTRTKVFYVLSAINEKYNHEALQALLKAKELAPTDAKVYYNLALLYGRTDQKNKAIETLKETILLKKNYPDPYFALALYLDENGQRTEAIQSMEYLLKNLDPKNKPAQEKLKEWKR